MDTSWKKKFFTIACLLTVVVPDIPQSAEKVHLLADTKQGFRAMCGNKPLMAAFFPILVASMLYQPLGALYPLLVRSHYQGEVWHIGVGCGWPVICWPGRMR